MTLLSDYFNVGNSGLYGCGMCKTKRRTRFHKRDVLQAGTPVLVLGYHVAYSWAFDASNLGYFKAKHGVFGVLGVCRNDVGRCGSKLQGKDGRKSAYGWGYPMYRGFSSVDHVQFCVVSVGLVRICRLHGSYDGETCIGQPRVGFPLDKADVLD